MLLQCKTKSDLNDPDNYFITVPIKFVRSKGWERGDDMGFFVVSKAVLPEPGDILIKRVRGRVIKNVKRS